jgi:hypothetical protein
MEDDYKKHLEKIKEIVEREKNSLELSEEVINYLDKEIIKYNSSNNAIEIPIEHFKIRNILYEALGKVYKYYSTLKNDEKNNSIL